ncbi:MAG: RHS repeat protein [Bdellovibrionales bacterium]|nr:RHS repeat protein [Bdellovibrionales bacterium]
MRGILSIFAALTIAPAYAIVDMKNANYAHTFTDIEVPGTGYDLKVKRTYNSRSLFSGVFGFGWCSEWETSLTVTAEGFLRVVECGAGLQLTYKPKQFDKKAVEKTIARILEEVKKRNPKKPKSFFSNLENNIRNDELLRQDFEEKLNLRGNVADNVKYIVDGRDNEFIIKAKGSYTRTLTDGSKQKFNTQGQLEAMYDKNNNYLKFDYSGNQLTSVTDNSGRKLTIKYSGANKKVSSILGPNGMKSSYTFKGEDLASMTNAWGNSFSYVYDDLHNLTKITYPDKSTRELTYNKDKDWVTSFKNRKNCLEKYEYKSDKNDPMNHYWSNVVKLCGKEVVNKSTYEFWHKDKFDGTGKFLYRVKSDVNSDVTDIVYHEIFGKPISVSRNSTHVQYEYYDDGRVKLKKEPLRDMAFIYKNKCEKVSEVKIEYFQPVEKKTKGKKLAQAEKRKSLRTITTKFMYDNKHCNLVFAQNSIGQTAQLSYDKSGRISAIKDQSKKVVTIKYESRFGKPSIVSRPGLGTIKVAYDQNGDVKNVDSKDGPKVAVQVASIFNNLLDIIAPATSETPL